MLNLLAFILCAICATVHGVIGNIEYFLLEAALALVNLPFTIKWLNKVLLNILDNKNKIVIGKTGSGKSFYILSKLVKPNKINIIVDYITGGYTEVYKTNFPFLRKYKEYFIDKMSLYLPVIKENLWISSNSINNREDIFKIIRWNNEVFPALLSNFRFIFLDSSWNVLDPKEKLQMLWILCNCNAEIVIELQDLDELLDMKLDNDMVKDLKKYWKISECKEKDVIRRL